MWTHPDAPRVGRGNKAARDSAIPAARCERPPVRTRSLLLWILIVAAIAFVAHRSGQFGTRNPGAPLSGPARVVDGDSLEIGGQRVRLFGIDAPEGRQHCRNAQGQDFACGREAARALDTLIGGRSVTCTRGRSRSLRARGRRLHGRRPRSRRGHGALGPRARLRAPQPWPLRGRRARGARGTARPLGGGVREPGRVAEAGDAERRGEEWGEVAANGARASRSSWPGLIRASLLTYPLLAPLMTNAAHADDRLGRTLHASVKFATHRAAFRALHAAQVRRQPSANSSGAISSPAAVSAGVIRHEAA